MSITVTQNKVFLNIFFIYLFVLSNITGCIYLNKDTNLGDSSEKDKLSKKAEFISASDFGADDWAAESYIIEMGDVLEISVWQIDNLQREVVVRPDGKISFPLIGDVLAQGKTIEEVREEISEKIKLYIKVPQVSVNIIEFGGKKVVILGEVRSRGVIRFNSPTSIIEAVGLAGGFVSTANKDRIFVIRDFHKEVPKIIMVNANEILKKGDLRQNVFVRTGDIIYVHKSFVANFNYFIDNVFGPVVDSAQSYYGDTWKRLEAGKWKYPSNLRGYSRP